MGPVFAINERVFLWQCPQCQMFTPNRHTVCQTCGREADIEELKAFAAASYQPPRLPEPDSVYSRMDRVVIGLLLLIGFPIALVVIPLWLIGIPLSLFGLGYLPGSQ